MIKLNCSSLQLTRKYLKCYYTDFVVYFNEMTSDYFNVLGYVENVDIVLKLMLIYFNEYNKLVKKVK